MLFLTSFTSQLREGLAAEIEGDHMNDSGIYFQVSCLLGSLICPQGPCGQGEGNVDSGRWGCCDQDG